MASSVDLEARLKDMHINMSDLKAKVTADDDESSMYKDDRKFFFLAFLVLAVFVLLTLLLVCGLCFYIRHVRKVERDHQSQF